MSRANAAAETRTNFPFALLGIVLGVTAGLSACTSPLHYKAYGTFEPYADGFRFETIPYITFEKEEDEEGKRIQAMNELVAANKVCPDGYEIRERKRVVTKVNAGRIIYYGKCK